MNKKTYPLVSFVSLAYNHARFIEDAIAGALSQDYPNLEIIMKDDGSFKYCANNLFMDGKSIFDFSSLTVPQVVEQTLVKNGISKDQVDWYIFHQANMFMLNFARMRCGAPQEKFVVDLEDGGNTVSSTIPIVMKRMMDNNRLNQGQTLLLCGFGVGLSIAGVILKM